MADIPTEYPMGDGTMFTPTPMQNKIWYYTPTDNKHCWSAQPDGGESRRTKVDPPAPVV